MNVDLTGHPALLLAAIALLVGEAVKSAKLTFWCKGCGGIAHHPDLTADGI